MAVTELAPGGPPPSSAAIGSARAAAEARREQGLPPDPAEAREALELAASRALDELAPEIDEETDLRGAAEWLGFPGPSSIRGRWRKVRIDGTPAWPSPHPHPTLHVDVWTYRELAVAMALQPGRGRPGYRRGPNQRTRGGREKGDPSPGPGKATRPEHS